LHFLGHLFLKNPEITTVGLEKVFLNYVKVEKRFEAIKIAEHPYLQ
jgi:hypothetical protein